MPLSVTTFGQNDSIRTKFIKHLTEDIYRNCISKDMAKEMCDTINFKFSSGRYDSSLNLDEFSFEITKDLRRICHDDHINITPLPIKYSNSEPNDIKKYKLRKYNKRKAEAQFQTLLEQTKHDKFSYGDVMILKGNIGYLEIKNFENTSPNKKENKERIKIESVMSFLEKCNSLILDLRNNQGGVIDQAANFCSYFAEFPNTYFITAESHFRFDSMGIQKDLIFTDTLHTREVLSKYSQLKKIYILISQRTFSAAGLTAYAIKKYNLHTTIIGEKTNPSGNGHSGGFSSEYYYVLIPSIKLFDESNPTNSVVSKGIIPDIESPSESAFEIAYNAALKNTVVDINEKEKYYKKNDTFQFDDREPIYRKKYPEYIGDFRKILITIESNKLYMIYDSYRKMLLVPDAPDFFLTQDFEFVRFERDTNNIVKEIQIKHKNGYLEKFSKK